MEHSAAEASVSILSIEEEVGVQLCEEVHS